MKLFEELTLAELCCMEKLGVPPNIAPKVDRMSETGMSFLLARIGTEVRKDGP